MPGCPSASRSQWQQQQSTPARAAEGEDGTMASAAVDVVDESAGERYALANISHPVRACLPRPREKVNSRSHDLSWALSCTLRLRTPPVLSIMLPHESPIGIVTSSPTPRACLPVVMLHELSRLCLPPLCTPSPDSMAP